MLAGISVLAVPTAVAPESRLASITYLVALGSIVVVLAVGASRWTGAARRGWRFVAAAATCWFAGDLAQRALVAAGHEDGVGLPDVFWLASYPLLVVGVGWMIHGRRLGVDVRREVALDVLVVTVAGAVGAWKLMIAPEISDGTLTLEIATTVLYPLGDVALLGTALTLLIAPGRPSLAGRLLVACLGATLVIDAAFTALPPLFPDLNIDWLDGLLLAVNGLLAGAVVHPSGGRLAEPPARDERVTRLHRWRVVLLGVALVLVSVVAVLPAHDAPLADALVLLAGAAATSVTVVVRFYGVVKGREHAEELLVHQARHDGLTGLANRRQLLERLDEAIATCRPTGERIVLVYLDLDGFKAVNDRFGHAGGDAVLTTIGERLDRATRSTDTVARIGGDEFVVLCDGLPDDVVDAFGAELAAAITEPIDLPGGDRATVGVSIGIARVDAPDDPSALDQAERILRRADAAMYTAKQLGGGVRHA